MGLIIRLVAWISCAIAVALTALRFLQLRQPLAQQALGYLPWTIPLFTLALLVFLAHLFFPGKSRWQITMALAAVSLLGLLLQVWWLSPLFIGDKPVAGNLGRRMRTTQAHCWVLRVQATFVKHGLTNVSETLWTA